MHRLYNPQDAINEFLQACTSHDRLRKLGCRSSEVLKTHDCA